MIPYKSPILNESAFNCPHCQAFSRMLWYHINHQYPEGSQRTLPNYTLATCTNCAKPSFWFNDKMIYPRIMDSPYPNSDMPDDVKNDYEEARKILSDSPRGAAALLRLCVQKLCLHLGEKGKNINDDIKELVKKGLNPTIQKSLDIVRVIGGEAVHPGQIDLNDDPSIANHLFVIVNLIVESMISIPKSINETFEKLPDNKRLAIEKRDSK